MGFWSSLVDTLSALMSLVTSLDPVILSLASNKEPLRLGEWSSPAVDQPISWPILRMSSLGSELRLRPISTSWYLTLRCSMKKSEWLRNIRADFIVYFAYWIMVFDLTTHVFERQLRKLHSTLCSYFILFISYTHIDFALLHFHFWSTSVQSTFTH